VGLVLDGRIYRGVTGAAGEVGYLPIGDRPAGKSGPNARGMFEEVVAADAVIRYARAAGLSGRITAERVFELARQGHPQAREAVVVQARQLAMAVASIAAFLDPQAIVMGGRIGQNLDLLEPSILETLREVTPMRPTLVAGELGEEAVIRGAVVRGTALARDAVFTDRLLAAG
jgi:predicted NBD/HSP70 family sugar kinase